MNTVGKDNPDGAVAKKVLRKQFTYVGSFGGVAEEEEEAAAAEELIASDVT